jgi:undecaprenyl-phosphate 4-deoxy-4-formamido-L-arabinose transferase
LSNIPSSSASFDLQLGRPPRQVSVDLSLVIPAYNEEKEIEALVRSACAVLGSMSDNYEIIVINDGSKDGTGAVLANLALEFSVLRPISLRINSGQHIATYIGLREARGNLVFTADADLKEGLSGLPALYKTAGADETCDIVSGIRPQRSRLMHRSVGSWVVTKIVNRLTGTNLRDPVSPMRLYRRYVVDSIVDADILAQNLPILTALLGLRVREIPLDIPDTGRHSRYNFLGLVHILLLALLNFSAGTRTILTLIGIGAVSGIVGIAGMAFLTVYGIVEKQQLSTNLLLLFVLLFVVGLQFGLMGAIAYKLERINTNLRFRQLVYGTRYDRPY